MTAFPETTLLIVGRSAKYDGEQYYTNSAHRDLIEGMAEEFNLTIYLCQRNDVPTDVAERYGRIDETKIQIRANAEWAQSSHIGKKYASLFSDIRFVHGLDGPIVTYTYYPGFYSFFLSPFVFRKGDVNIGHSGSDAIDTADAAYSGSFVGRTKGMLYQWFQTYVLNNIDIIFATDPRMVENYDTEVVLESKPLIQFSKSDFRDPPVSRSGAILLLTVGVFRPVKGYEYLIDAMAHLVEHSEQEYRLRMVGDGATKPEIERRVQSLNLQDVVEFTGYVRDEDVLVSHYDAADVFVLPSLKESVPRVLYEATLRGLPVVCTQVGGIPAFFDDEHDALLVGPKNTEALADAIDRLGEDPNLCKQLVKNAQERIEWYVTGDPVDQRLELITDATEFG